MKRTSYSYPKIRQAGRFAVNILSGEQMEVSDQFARQGEDKWREVDWTASPLGNPLTAGSVQWLDCEIHAEHVAGDHLIVIGEVKGLGREQAAGAGPLVYFRGRYRGLKQIPSAESRS